MKGLKAFGYFILGFFISTIYLGIIGSSYGDINKFLDDNVASVFFLLIIIPLLLHSLISRKKNDIGMVIGFIFVIVSAYFLFFGDYNMFNILNISIGIVVWCQYAQLSDKEDKKEQKIDFNKNISMEDSLKNKIENLEIELISAKNELTKIKERLFLLENEKNKQLDLSKPEIEQTKQSLDLNKPEI